jgi:hypothetical protein
MHAHTPPAPVPGGVSNTSFSLTTGSGPASMGAHALGWCRAAVANPGSRTPGADVGWGHRELPGVTGSHTPRGLTDEVELWLRVECRDTLASCWPWCSRLSSERGDR